jgi:hypothetical protein
MDSAMMIEMGYDHERMPEPLVTLPTLAMDDECYGLTHQKATAGNRLPVKVLDDALHAALLGEVEIEVEHPTAVQVVEKTFTTARHSTSQSLAKRTTSAELNPHFDKGRKVLSVERDGKLKITKFEGGELLEIVED